MLNGLQLHEQGLNEEPEGGEAGTKRWTAMLQRLERCAAEESGRGEVGSDRAGPRHSSGLGSLARR